MNNDNDNIYTEGYVKFSQHIVSKGGTVESPNLVLRQVVGVKLQRGCNVTAVQRLRQKIESCPINGLGQLQREIYEREIESYRQKFLVDYDNKWVSAASMGKFLTNWYGHRIIGFNPTVSVNLHTDTYSVIYYG